MEPNNDFKDYQVSKEEIISPNRKEEAEENEDIEILKMENDSDQRRELDKENLLKAFYFGMDLFEHCISINEENEDTFELKYKNLEEKLNEIFSIEF